MGDHLECFLHHETSKESGSVGQIRIWSTKHYAKKLKCLFRRGEGNITYTSPTVCSNSSSNVVPGESNVCALVASDSTVNALHWQEEHLVTVSSIARSKYPM